MGTERGKFIVFESIEGGGKSTQTRMLCEYLKRNNINIHKTREASDGPIGKLIRDVYLSGKREVDPRIINLLYVPDRLDHITNKEDGILKKIEDGITVVSDRYYMSSAAIHSSLYFNDNTERLKAMVDIIDMNKINIELLRPDITFYIKTSADVAIDRIHKRNDKSIFDNYEYMVKQEVCYESSIEYIRANSDETIICIDGNRSAKEVHEDVIKEVNKLLGI